MKRILALMALAACFQLTAWAQKIENPPLNCNTLGWKYTVSLLENSGTALRLEQTVYGNPGKSEEFPVDFIVRANGQTLHPLQVEGVSDGKVTYDEHCAARVSFLYPSLPEGVAELDWIHTGGRGFFGIQVSGEVAAVSLPDSVVNRVYTPDYQLPEFAFKHEKAVIEGVILGYRPEMNLQIGFSAHDWFFYKPFRENVKIEPDGRFRIEKELVHPLLLNFLIARQCYQRVFLAPGSRVQMYISLPDLFADVSTLLYRSCGEKMERKPLPYRKKLWFMGDHADFNTDLERCSDTWDSPFEHTLMIPADYTTQRWTEEVESLVYQYRADKINAVGGISDVCRDYLLLDAKMAMASMLNTVFRYKDNESYAFRSDYSDDFRKMYEELERENLASPYADLVSFCHEHYQRAEKLGLAIELPAYWKDFRIAKPIAKELLKSKPLTEEQLRQLKTMGNAEIRAYLLERNEQIIAAYRKMLEKGGHRIHQLDATKKGEAILPALVEPFKGKVVLIDFWATWCGPCKRAMKTMIPMKAGFPDGEVAFVYIAEPSSNRELWEGEVAKIPGEHYFITSEQFATLQKQFGFSSIPFYLVIDKAGRVHYQHSGASGLEQLKAAIEEALKR